MPTVEELLMMAETEPREEVQEYCEIDPITRTITIPERYALLGVESDEKTERVWFRCPKVVGDNIDLTALQMRINYQNANEEKDQYIVTDVTTQGSYIVFSWLLSRKVTKYKGDVSFIVCAVKVNGETITNEWNTTLAHSEVLEGLEIVTPQPTEEESDVIVQLLQIVKDASDSAVQAVQDAEQQALEKIGSIPYVENHIIKFGTGTVQEGE